MHLTTSVNDSLAMNYISCINRTSYLHAQFFNRLVHSARIYRSRLSARSTCCHRVHRSTQQQRTEEKSRFTRLFFFARVCEHSNKRRMTSLFNRTVANSKLFCNWPTTNFAACITRRCWASLDGFALWIIRKQTKHQYRPSNKIASVERSS